MVLPVQNLLASLGLGTCMTLYGIGVWNGNSAFATGDLFESVSQEISLAYPLIAAVGMLAGIAARILFSIATRKSGKGGAAFVICAAAVTAAISIGGLWESSSLLFRTMAFSAGWTFSCASLFWVNYISTHSLPANIVLPLALLFGAGSKTICLLAPQTSSPSIMGGLALASALLVFACQLAKKPSTSQHRPHCSLANLAKQSFRALEKFADVLICIMALQIIAPSINYLGLMDALGAQTQSFIVCIAQLSAGILSFLFLNLSKASPHSIKFFQYVTPCLILALFFVPFASHGYTIAMLLIGSCLYFTAADALFQSDAIGFPHKDSVPFELFYATGYFALMATSVLMENLMPRILDTSSSTELLTVFAVFFCVYVLSMAFMVARKRKDERPQEEAQASIQDDHAAEKQRQDDFLAQQPQTLENTIAIAKQRYTLSNREAEILGLILRGKNVPAIAETLFISQNTVRSHIKRIYRAADVHTRQELISHCEAIDKAQ